MFFSSCVIMINSQQSLSVFGGCGYENSFISLPVWCTVMTSKFCQTARRPRSPEGSNTPCLPHPRRMKERAAFLFSFNVHYSAPSSDICVSHDDFVSRRARSEPKVKHLHSAFYCLYLKIQLWWVSWCLKKTSCYWEFMPLLLLWSEK